MEETEQILRNFGLIVVTGLLSRAVAALLRLPEMVMLAAVGALIGPSVLGLVENPLGGGAQLVFTIGVPMILFHGSIGISLRVNPSPVRERIPILIGGGDEKVTLRIVAEHAHIWNGLGDPQEAGRKSGILDGWCEKVGRDPNEIERSIAINDYSRIKDADGCVENGITQRILGFNGPDYDLSPLRELIYWHHSRNGG